MAVRFLLFGGNWENEGNFYLLETEKNIIIIASGKGYSSFNLPEQQIGLDYLKENRNKVGAIIVNNTNFQNIGLLEDISHSLGFSVPIYTSSYSKLILSYLFPQLRNRVIIPLVNKGLKIGDFSLFFSPMNSFLIGNLGLAVHYFEYSFYFLEAFMFSNLLNSNLLFPPTFLPNFQHFLTQKKKHTYLITSCQGFHWQNNNSLFFVTRNFPEQNKPLFFLFYDFDWLHIFELLEIMHKRGKKVRILNKVFASLIGQILIKDQLNEVITESPFKKDENAVYLSVGNPENIRSNLETSLSNFSRERITNFHFVVGIPPVIGGEEKFARLIDYLYTQSEEITNLSKKEYLNLGVSFHDFKLLINLLHPTGVITLQNSYKNVKFFDLLPVKFLTLDNCYAWDFSTRKTTQLKKKKILISLEELLVKQRDNLGQGGLLIIVLIVEWKEGKLELKKLKIESLAVSSVLEISKLESKIKNWWGVKLVPDIKRSDPIKIIKKAVERRLSGLISSYLSLKCGIELGESLILLFNH